MAVVLAILLQSAWMVMAQVTVEEHWSPYDYPETIDEGVPFHIIEKGDTLWDLAERYLGDPTLWPQLYQKNAYIQDPDLIYPGDPVILEVGVVVNPDTIARSLDDEGGEGSEGSFPATSDEIADMEAMEETGPTGDPGMDDDGPRDSEGSSQDTIITDGIIGSEFVILPAGDRSDMECSTYIYETGSSREKLPFDILISGSEDKYVTAFSEGDVLYLNKGMNRGIQAGEEYSVRRRLRSIYDPETGRKFIGVAVDQIGKVRVVAVQEENATVVALQGCQEIQIGDFLVPYEQEPIPLITELPVANRWEKFPTDGFGTIIYAEDNIISFGKGHLANIDIGIDQNVAPGDLFIIYRENPNNNERQGMMLPDVYLGHGVILKTNTRFSIMKVIDVHTNLMVGDRVVPL
jgi:hypothetical protein